MSNNNNYTYIHELEELDDILETIEPEVNEKDDLIFYEDEHAVDFVETALHLMEIYIQENPTAISEPDFQEVFQETIEELFYIQFEQQILQNELIEDDITEILQDAFHIFFSTLYELRENDFDEKKLDDKYKCKEETDDDEDDNDGDNLKNELLLMEAKINNLRSKPQPVQRTKEWYEFRHNLITASNAYKAFESQATKNQLIYEKCQPLPSVEETSKPPSVNVNSTFHWGQKYEPLSVMIYEYLYNTTIEDFGCIKHEKYHFLGASPDGINVDPNNKTLYGRMLEIKNIVNREITGIPKKEYWIQTQLQMEVCDLDECDFLETKFVEYENYDAFCNDVHFGPGQYKGEIMYFITTEGRPHYEYKPIEEDNVLEWEDSTMDKCEAMGMMWMKNCYWKLEKLSCVLITRNKKWFQDNIQGIAEIWSIIEKERVTGFQHRAPVKRIKKDKAMNGSSTLDNYFEGNCYLKITKLPPLEQEQEQEQEQEPEILDDL